MSAQPKLPEAVLTERKDGRDWARKILARENAGERFTVAVLDMAKRALGMPVGSAA